MSENRPKLPAALVIACAALALSIYAVARGASNAKEPGANACIDQEVRAQLDKLRRALAERDAVIARLARAASAPSGTSTAAEPSPRPVTPPDPGPRRYARFETPNPAVSVTQKADGTYDIHTTDPALAGSVMQVTAVTQSGDEDKLLIRIP